MSGREDTREISSWWPKHCYIRRETVRKLQWKPHLSEVKAPASALSGHSGHLCCLQYLHTMPSPPIHSPYILQILDTIYKLLCISGALTLTVMLRDGPTLDTGLWLVESDHMTWILVSDWLRVITWPGCLPLIGSPSHSTDHLWEPDKTHLHVAF